MVECLIVDDNNLSSTVMYNQVSRIGLSAVVCANGKEAIERCVKKGMPQLIMLDGYMPEMDGIEFIKRLRQMEGGDYPYVVFCSSSLDRPDIEKALNLGANCHFPKPLSNDQMNHCISEAAKHNGLSAYKPEGKNHRKEI